MKFDKLGWFIAVALAGVMLGSGFQNSTGKFGSVDMEKVFNDAEATKANQAKLQEYVNKRMEVLRFIGRNQVMNPTDVKTYADLSLKESPTPTEQTQLTKITGDAQSATTAQQALVQKQNPTPDELGKLNSFSSNAQQNQAAVATLKDQYGAEAEKKQTELRNEVLDKVRTTVASLAKKDGYTTVFTTDCAPYSANDLTQDALNSINKH